MADLEKARATQLANIEKRTGKSLGQLAKIIRDSGLTRHSELVAMLKREQGLGHGDANMLVHTVRSEDAAGGAAAGAKAGGTAKSRAAAASTKTAQVAAGADTHGAALDALYVGPKAALRPIHDRLLEAMTAFGDCETAPKKTYVSYRRAKQFAMIGPATRTMVEVGINAKDLEPTDRLEALPPGRMCQFRVRLGGVSDVDAELVGWLRRAYDASGG